MASHRGPNREFWIFYLAADITDSYSKRLLCFTPYYLNAMKTETTHERIKVDIKITAAELVSLERDGEILAHTDDNVPDIGIITEGSGKEDAYESEEETTYILLTPDEILDIAKGESRTWTMAEEPQKIYLSMA